MTAKIKILTAIYIFILAVIVFVADVRGTNFFAFIKLLPYGDKIWHFCLAGMLSFLVNLVLSAKTFQIWKVNYLLGSLIVLAIVTLEEFSQIFIRGRSFDKFDLAADYLGIFVFGEIARRVYKRND